jgi:hypothetical protein
LRRKILQDFANTFCQQFLDLGSGHDVATLVRLGSGSYSLDLLSGACTRDGTPIPELKVCREYRGWLQEQMMKHRVPAGVVQASFVVDVTVRRSAVKESFGHHSGSAT